MTGAFSLDRRDLLISAAGAAAAIACPVGAAAGISVEAIALGRRQSLDLGWRFNRGNGNGFEVPGLDDAGWRTVDLPHDWSIEDLPSDPAGGVMVGPFDKSAPGGTAVGFSVGGEGWYRKRFRIVGKPGLVEILFDGVYIDSDVWLNGRKLDTHRNGYTPFAYDLTPYLISDAENVLAVHVRNLGKTARWYSGSGIYRHVWLDVLAEPTRLDRWGTRIATRRIADGSAHIEIETNALDIGGGLTLTTRIHDADGRSVWHREVRADTKTRQTASIANAQLWSPDKPYLYAAVLELRRGSVTLDRLEMPFGARIVAFDPAAGMTINGVPTKLRGGCIHHDNGLLGAAAFDDAEARKVALLKARGFNAVRPSHNLFSPGFLAACDAQGMMVVCETFDVWREPKTQDDYSKTFVEDWKRELDTIVRSSRNHPSIIVWSIGNEIPGRSKPEGIELQWRLANEVHRLDPTRPVTAAIHGFAGHVATTAADALSPGATVFADRTGTVFLDLVGYNYKLADYDADHTRFPKRIFLGTESFPKDVFAIWDKTERSPWLIGDFVWTAMDYLGEAGIGGSEFLTASAQGRVPPTSWPWVNAYCGDLDLIGHQKPQSFARDVAWGVSALEIAVQCPASAGTTEVLRSWGWHDERQSWTWAVGTGHPLTLRAYTSGDRVEVHLNGRKIDVRPVLGPERVVEFAIPYAPGTLEVVAYHGTRLIGRKQLATVGPPSALRLREENRIGTQGVVGLTFVTVDIVDAAGHVVPDVERAVTASVEGAGKLLAFGSADPLARGSYRSGTATTWRGRSLAVVRGSVKSGRTIVMARSDGLTEGLLSIRHA